MKPIWQGLTVLFWVSLGITLGNWFGAIPDNPTLHNLYGVPFWSWVILWPLCLIREMPWAALVVTLLLILMILFYRWNWPEEKTG